MAIQIVTKPTFSNLHNTLFNQFEAHMLANDPVPYSPGDTFNPDALDLTFSGTNTIEDNDDFVVMSEIRINDAGPISVPAYIRLIEYGVYNAVVVPKGAGRKDADHVLNHLLNWFAYSDLVPDQYTLDSGEEDNDGAFVLWQSIEWTEQDQL